MSDRELVISRSSNRSIDDFRAEMDLLWSDLRDARSPLHAEFQAFLHEQHLPRDPADILSEQASSDLRIRPSGQHLDPASGVVIVVTWLGVKLAGKAVDAFWDRFVKQRLDQLWGQSAVTRVQKKPE